MKIKPLRSDEPKGFLLSFKVSCDETNHHLFEFHEKHVFNKEKRQQGVMIGNEIMRFLRQLIHSERLSGGLCDQIGYFPESFVVYPE